MGAGRGQPGRPARRRARAVFGAWPERRRHSNTAGWLPGRAAVRPAPVAVLHQEPTALASAPAAPARPPAHYRQAMHADFGLDGQGTLRVWLFTDVSNVRRARVGLERDLGWTSARAGRTGLLVGERRRHAATPPHLPSQHPCGSSLKDRVVAGDIQPEFAFLNAALVPSSFGLRLAAFTARGAAARGRARARSEHTELVLHLSGGKNVSRRGGERGEGLVGARAGGGAARLSLAPITLSNLPPPPPPPPPPSTHFPSPDRRRTQAVWPVARHQARAGGPARRQRCRREWWGRARAEVKAAPACSTPARLPHPQPPLPPTYQPCRRPS